MAKWHCQHDEFQNVDSKATQDLSAYCITIINNLITTNTILAIHLSAELNCYILFAQYVFHEKAYFLHQ